MTRRLSALLMALAIAPIAGAQQYGALEARHHYRYSNEQSGLRYRATKIFRLPNNTESSETWLFEDESGKRMTLVETRDYLRQTKVLEITDLETKDVARVTVQFPFKATTLQETIVEGRAWLATESIDLPMTLEVNGVSFAAKESEWKSERHTRNARSSLRRAGSPVFLERLERLRPIVAGGELILVCHELLRYVLYNVPCREELQPERAFGDCSFDAAFGHPCSERQKKRVRESADAGEPSAY